MSADLKRILVAVDGSEHSDYALNVAVKIGEKYSSAIDLIHVEPPKAAELIEKADNILEDRVEIVKERNLSCNPIAVRSSDPASEILKTAESGGYSLVVLGSRGLGNIKGLLMGSVSAKVAKECKKSALVVKTRIEIPPKVLLGYDGSTESDKALDFAADLAAKLGASIEVVSVYNIPMAPEAYIGTEVDKWENDMRNMVESAVSKLRAKGIQSKGEILDHTNVALALTEESEKGKYDFIVVGSRGLGKLKSLLLGSVASGVANNSKTNVLIVR